MCMRIPFAKSFANLICRVTTLQKNYLYRFCVTPDRIWALSLLSTFWIFAAKHEGPQILNFHSVWLFCRNTIPAVLEWRHPPSVTVIQVSMEIWSYHERRKCLSIFLSSPKLSSFYRVSNFPLSYSSVTFTHIHIWKYIYFSHVGRAGLKATYSRYNFALSLFLHTFVSRFQFFSPHIFIYVFVGAAHDCVYTNLRFPIRSSTCAHHNVIFSAYDWRRKNEGKFRVGSVWQYQFDLCFASQS